MKKRINIAIDGPAGAGKSTVARQVADYLSFLYIDTGAMYRALTYKAIEREVDLENGPLLKELLNETVIDLQVGEEEQHVLLDNKDVTTDIRSFNVTNNVSFVARQSEVREEMVKRQKLLADKGGVVMDGRDIGTHVLPNSELKVFLIASVEERASRRYKELIDKGIEADLDTIKNEIALRDKRDSEREVAPLVKADDAKEIDTTSMTISEVVDYILQLAKERA
ncbi:(d)CMP kinase [Pseudalkalibacillus hwajinpoensis]|uniref:Cytidylate kinase n=1 Tax=Guptibacillus hwajinpoensis TaxID=208199 RepID=A0A4U1MF74_9BACL|nr:(d)CMP kinase [Pseudalkalibacillus hwajinpoensis]TKD69869.1 (d)CMP kinase [Pseudalkalibacillus hwajinpoensis]